MNYPGRVIKAGEQDANIVKAIKKRLNKVLVTKNDSSLKLDPDDPNFGTRMKQVVKLFQARNVDDDGQPLKQDGQVGPLTWAALFGRDSVPSKDTSNDILLSRVLQIAATEEAKPVREDPPYSNRGPEVNNYLARVGLDPGYKWCCAFVYWCFDEAAKSTGRENPMVKTSGCLDHWRKAPQNGARRILKNDAIANPGLIEPGMIFIQDFGGAGGHTGLVEKIKVGKIVTIEGNTDGSGASEGGGVYRRTRKLSEINKGFIDYSRV